MILAKLLLEKPDVLLLDEPTNFLDKDHVSSLKDSFTKYTSKATTIGRAQGLMQKHFETLRPLLFYPKKWPGVKFCVSVFRQSQEWRWKTGRILAWIP